MKYHIRGINGLTRCGIGNIADETGDAYVAKETADANCDLCLDADKRTITHAVGSSGLTQCGFDTNKVRISGVFSDVTCIECRPSLKIQPPSTEQLFESIPFLQHIKDLFNAAIDYEMKRLKKNGSESSG